MIAAIAIAIAEGLPLFTTNPADFAGLDPSSKSAPSPAPSSRTSSSHAAAPTLVLMCSHPRRVRVRQSQRAACALEPCTCTAMLRHVARGGDQFDGGPAVLGGVSRGHEVQQATDDVPGAASGVIVTMIAAVARGQGRAVCLGRHGGRAGRGDRGGFRGTKNPGSRSWPSGSNVGWGADAPPARQRHAIDAARECTRWATAYAIATPLCQRVQNRTIAMAP